MRQLGFSMLLGLLIISGCKEPASSNNATRPITTASTPGPTTPEVVIAPAAYTIISQSDNSIKAMDEPLSSYTAAEIAALPTNKRISISAAITSTIAQEQIEPTLRTIIEAARSADADLDEVTVFLYSEPASVGGVWDIGTALWAPGGKRGNVTAVIASSNDRSTYRTVVDVRPDVEEYLARRSEAGDQFGLSLEQRREYFRKTAQAELDAMTAADEQINPMDDVMGNIELSSDLLSTALEELRAQYGIDEEAHQAISFEGFQNGWPMQ